MIGPIFLTGASGQVGGELEPMLGLLGKIEAPRRAGLDLSDLDAVRHFIRELRPRWIINAAAYTAVDKAEAEPGKAFRINAALPGVLGEEAAKLNAVVIHFSTDYVFAGTGSKPYIEDDPTGPLGVYGASKLAGEETLAESGAAHFIFRTSWVYDATGKNFLRTILKLASERDELKIVADQHGAPTWARDLARLTMHTITRCDSTGDSVNAARHLGGIYHACDEGETTWYGFAQEFVRLAEERKGGKWATLKPISTTEYPTPAKRPSNSRMSSARLKRVLEFSMPEWRDSLATVMERIELQLTCCDQSYCG